MFFILSKTLGALTVPSNVLIAFMLIGFVLLFTRWARAGQRLLIVCVAVFLVVGAMPVGSALTAALENRFPAWVETAAPPDGIIILGGPVKIGISRARGTVELDRSAEGQLIRSRGRPRVAPSLAEQRHEEIGRAIEDGGLLCECWR